MVDKANAALLAQIEAGEGGAVEVVGVCRMGAKPKPLTAWYGGKARLAPIIARMVEKIPHKNYVEPFAGMCGVLMAKRASECEIVNDLHDGIIHLFRTVKNPETCRALLRQLEMTPYARNEWRLCQGGWETETDPIEKARMVYVTLAQNFVGMSRGGSWSFGGAKSGKNVAQVFVNGQENISAVCQRLRTVLIENADALTIMRQWDNPETVIYADPPYLPETRNAINQYRHELEDHTEFLQFCSTSTSAIILSGYPSELYTSVLEKQHGWTRLDIAAVSSAALNSTANGRKNNPNAKTAKRIECLWLNPAAQRNQQPTLWQEAAS